MCNPRRIRVTATRQLNQAWEREVSRTVELNQQVIGEARVRQSLDATLGASALRALESALAADDSGWREVEEGYRYDVEGGYVIYLLEERALEIVATLQDEVQTSAQATRRLEGTVNTEISAEGEGRYYDDNWGGRTKQLAEKKAQEDAQQQLDKITRTQIEQAESAAEDRESADVEAEARTQAQEQLQQIATQRQEDLSAQARQHLNTVGVRCRQAFHQALARGYRDAILAYARRNGADNIQCNEDGNIVEIEFDLRS